MKGEYSIVQFNNAQERDRILKRLYSKGYHWYGVPHFTPPCTEGVIFIRASMYLSYDDIFSEDDRKYLISPAKLFYEGEEFE